MFATTVVVADYVDPSAPLPAHRLVFNTIGDADLTPEALVAAEAIVGRTAAPVVNPPARIVDTGRAQVAHRLNAVAGLRAPRMAELPRAMIEGRTAKRALLEHGLSFPLLMRAPGYHTGRHFARIERPRDLEQAVARLPGDRFTAIEYLDARGLDGRWRKYRAMMIDGTLYPLHLAIANDWKVHYFTAAMAEQPAFRSEEAAFLDDMGSALGPRATAALQGVCTTLGLDYGGIDFGLDADGTVLLFEANATMVINPAEPDARWDYRRPAIQKALDAARRLLVTRAGAGPVPPG